MQVVGKFQAVTNANSALVTSASETIQGWANNKFEKDSSGLFVVKKSGAEALFDQKEFEVAGSRLVNFEILEPVPNGHLQTTVRILGTSENVYFNCILSIDSIGGLAPPQIDLHAPRFIREIIGVDGKWQFALNAENILGKYINISIEDVDQFLALLQTRIRRLPLIVISEFDGRTIAGDAHTRISADLCGLAHTCRINQEASWEITRRLGKEWSAYNGSTRLFWPFRANSENPWNHPLWTFDNLTRRGNSEPEIRDWLRKQLRDQLLDASTFLSDDPAFNIFHTSMERNIRDQARRPSFMSEGVAEEIRSLRDEIDSKDREIAILSNNVEALTIALRSQPIANGNKEDNEESPPTTVAEALALSRRIHCDSLIFGDDLDEQIKDLNPSAGPPEKILRYLNSLADLSSILASGSAGKSIPIWLRDVGVEASGESETKNNNRESRRARTFKIEGRDIYCEFHAKPSDGVSPDLCARIYFNVPEKSSRIQIGYLGRHFD